MVSKWTGTEYCSAWWQQLQVSGPLDFGLRCRMRVSVSDSHYFLSTGVHSQAYLQKSVSELRVFGPSVKVSCKDFDSYLHHFLYGLGEADANIWVSKDWIHAPNH